MVEAFFTTSLSIRRPKKWVSSFLQNVESAVANSTATVVVFMLGRWLFEVGNFIFVFLLSACLGCAYYGVAWLMAPLQNLAFNVQDTLDKSLVQAIFMPFAWQAIVAVRKKTVKEE